MESKTTMDPIDFHWMDKKTKMQKKASPTGLEYHESK